MPLHHYFFYAMVGIEIIFLVPFTLNYSRFNKEERLIYVYLISCVIYGIGSDVLARIFGNNMAFITSLYYIQFIILSLFYINVLKSASVQKALKWIVLGATLLFVADIAWLEGPLKYNSIFIATRTALMIGYGVIFFLQLMRDEGLIEQSIYINSLPVFWFNAGLFVNFCCGFLLNLTFNLIQRGGPGEVLVSMYKITAALYWISGIIQIILFYIGLLKIKRARA